MPTQTETDPRQAALDAGNAVIDAIPPGRIEMIGGNRCGKTWLADNARNTRELLAWRELAPRIDAALGRLLEIQGDAADPDLVRLQHRVAILRRLPANSEQAAPLAVFEIEDEQEPWPWPSTRRPPVELPESE